MGLTLADVMMEIEDQLNVGIDETDEQKFRRVCDIVEYIWERSQKDSASIKLRPIEEIHKGWFSKTKKVDTYEWVYVDVANKSDIEMRVRQIISKVGGVPLEKIKSESRLVEDLGLD